MTDVLLSAPRQNFSRLRDMNDGSVAEVFALGTAQKLLTCTILSGESVSDAVALGDLRLFEIVYPSGWTTAALTGQVSHDAGVTWHDIYLDGAEYSKTVAAGTSDNVDIQRFSSVSMLRLRSGTSATPVNQGGNRVFGLVARAV